MANKWDSLSKPERAKLLSGADLPIGLAQLNWSGLQKSERKKLEKGKGWFEAKEPIMTAKGIEHKAPEHHRVAVKKEAGKANNERMERKEPSVSKKPKEEKLSERRYKEWYDKGFAEAGKKSSIYKDVKSVEEDIEMVKESNRTPAPEVYAGIPNLSGLESLAKLEGIRDGLIAKAQKTRTTKEYVLLAHKTDGARVMSTTTSTTDKNYLGYYRLSLLKDNKQIDGMDFQVKEDIFAQKEIEDRIEQIIKRNNLIQRAVEVRREFWNKKPKPIKKEEPTTVQEEHKPFKEAQKNPKGGTVAMDEDNLQALSAEMIARRFGLNPEAVYNWGQKHNVILKDIIRNPKPIGDGTNLIEAVLNDTELSKPTINEFLNSKIHDLINSPSFETRGRLRQVLESLGLNTNMFFNHPQIYTDEQLQSVLDKMKSTNPELPPEERMEQIIKSGKEKEETEAEQLKKAREKWIAEEKSKPKRKAARIPEIEFNTEGQTTKKEVKRELTKLSTAFSKRYVDKHGWQYPTREKMPDGTYTVTWMETVQEGLPMEGLLIRGLTKEQAEEFRKELKEKVKSIKVEISIREGAGGKYELYTQVPIDPKSIKGALNLFTKRLGKKPKHITKGEPAQEPTPFFVEYKCGDEPPIKVPIEKLDEEIEKCKEMLK